MQLWTVLHIVSMFLAVTFAFGMVAFTTLAFRRRDIGALRAFARYSESADAISGLLLVLGIIFGVLAALHIGWDLLSGWLVIAYVLVGIAIIGGIASVPFARRLHSAVGTSDQDVAGPELERVFTSRQPYFWTLWSLVVYTLLIADMVVKPTF